MRRSSAFAAVPATPEGVVPVADVRSHRTSRDADPGVVRRRLEIVPRENRDAAVADTAGALMTSPRGAR